MKLFSAQPAAAFSSGRPASFWRALGRPSLSHGGTASGRSTTSLQHCHHHARTYARSTAALMRRLPNRPLFQTTARQLGACSHTTLIGGASPHTPRRTMFIKTETTPNPDSIKFLPGEKVMEEGTTMDFPDARASMKSPLAKALFGIPGIKRVFFSPDFIAVTKNENEDWRDLKTLVFAEIMDFYQSGQPLLLDEAAAEEAPNQIQPGDSETVAMIKEILETRIRPAVQEDGGDIRFHSFDEESGVVYLEMQGSCSGCPSSSVTLKSGIERMLMHWVSEVTGVVAVEGDELERLNLQQLKKVDEKVEKQQQAEKEATS
ncbi:NifU-like protein 4 mitochondrial [Balamuthia mandrillaris]